MLNDSMVVKTFYAQALVIFSNGHGSDQAAQRSGAMLATSNLPFDKWTSTLSSNRLTSSLIDRFTHHVPILGMNGESYRFATSKKQQRILNSNKPTERKPVISLPMKA